MRSIISLVLAGSLCAAGIVNAACPEGTFTVKGWNPGASVEGTPSYKGMATIETIGDTCQMTWTIGKQEFSGVGFYEADSKRLNIAYANLQDGWFGEVSYEVEDSTLTGKWAVHGEKAGKTGKEILEKKKD